MQFTKESIFVASIRSFCTSFATILGLLIGLILIFMGLMMMSGPNIVPEKSDLTIAADANGHRDLLPHTAPVVLKLNITGVIGQGELTAEKFSNLLLDSREGMLANNRVKAIFLYIDSPGGTVTDSVAIYQNLKAYKEKYKLPIYAFVDGMCASGGMYIACSADKIFASSSSVIGSVGVILGPTFNFSGLMERYGVQSLTLTQGKDKDMLNPFRPWMPGEDASLRNVTSVLYGEFVDTVIAARPHINREKLINDYGAQVYVSPTAQELGYIDVANSDYNAALNELTKAAQIPDDHFYQVVLLSPPHPFLSDLAGSCKALFQGKMTHVFQMGPYMNSDLSGKFLYLYQPYGEIH
ncbi:MAG: S49 family peptidase [Verrucomicrobia bacterium]|nr:S49 family peptidase [Verrucomicrobiota bacterium]